MKVQIPASVQELIKCNNCNELLSCGPVYLVNGTNEAICGRCSPQDAESSKTKEIRNRTRNAQYEATAHLLLFPCSFADRGCTQQLDFSSDEPNAHELNCDFRMFNCPIVDRNSCGWIGHPCNLIEHFRGAHPTHFLNNFSRVPTPNLTKSHLINYLITAYNLIFLLHLHVCKSTGKLYHSLRMIGDSEFLDNYTYCLEIGGNKNKLTEVGSILPRGLMALQQSTANYITITDLLDFFQGRYNEATFTIKIRNLIDNCINCQKIIENETNSTFCQECEGKLVKCEYHSENCSFVDLNKEKCRKHENFFCTYETRCYLCDVNFVGGSLIEHLSSSSSCRKTIKSNINSVVRLCQTDHEPNYIIFSCNTLGTIICLYILSESNLNLYLYSSLAWHELKYFKCSIKLTDPQTKQTKFLTPQINGDEEYDWIIEEHINNFPSVHNIGIDFKLILNKL